ncbi:MAG: gene transfer agent family protein [Hyphomicrobiaceae bacterium]
MVNARRGEIEARLDGRPYTLVLTLGALAELEAAFGDEDMLALASRFETGRISSKDAMRIIAAGLRGAGTQASESGVAAMRAEGGVAGYVDIVARLLAATFGSADEDGVPNARGCVAQSAAEAAEAAERRDPFPGAK